MSYDGWVQIPDPDNPTDAVVLAEIGNYTSNVGAMWRAALTSVVGEQVPGEQFRLQDTEGWTCERAYPVLAQAVDYMTVHRPELEYLTPSNGWGDYEGAVAYMQRVTELCRVYRAVPGAVLHWWC